MRRIPIDTIDPFVPYSVERSSKLLEREFAELSLHTLEAIEREISPQAIKVLQKIHAFYKGKVEYRGELERLESTLVFVEAFSSARQIGTELSNAAKLNQGLDKILLQQTMAQIHTHMLTALPHAKILQKETVNYRHWHTVLTWLRQPLQRAIRALPLLLEREFTELSLERLESTLVFVEAFSSAKKIATGLSNAAKLNQGSNEILQQHLQQMMTQIHTHMLTALPHAKILQKETVNYRHWHTVLTWLRKPLQRAIRALPLPLEEATMLEEERRQEVEVAATEAAAGLYETLATVLGDRDISGNPARTAPTLFAAAGPVHDESEESGVNALLSLGGSTK